MSKMGLLRAAFFTPLQDGYWGLPLLLWSEPGKAKTAMVKMLAQMVGARVKILPPGQMGEGMFGVIPMPVTGADGHTVITYPPANWLGDFVASDGIPVTGLAFIDETNTSPPALMAAVMGLILDRRLGDHLLPKSVRVFGAANPTSHSAGGWDLPPPMANRLGHITWPTPTPDEWSDWLLGGADGYHGDVIDAKVEEKRVLAEWPEAFAKAAGAVASFIRRKPNILHKMPEDGDPQQSRAWPSPRSWEMATRAWASATVNGLSEVEADELLMAFVGQAAAVEFAAWLRALDLPDPAQVLDGKVAWEHDATRLDRTHVVFASCTSLVAPQDSARRKERAAALWKLLATVTRPKNEKKRAKDLAVAPCRVLVSKEVRLAAMAEARPVLEDLQPLLAAAGITA